MRSAPALTFEIRRWRYLAPAMAVAGVLAAGMPWLSDVPPMYAAIGSVLAPLIALHTWWRLNRQTGTRVTRSTEGQWSLAPGGSATYLSHVALDHFVTLKLRDGRGRKVDLFLPEDVMSADEFRRLLVVLRGGAMKDERIL